MNMCFKHRTSILFRSQQPLVYPETNFISLYTCLAPIGTEFEILLENITYYSITYCNE